jgi:hypothetical protein
MLKNTVFKSASNSLGIPSGTSGLRPDSPIFGQTRWNTSLNKLEYYGNISGTPAWNSIASEGNVTLVRDRFSGNSAQTDFAMSVSYTASEENKVLVFVGTVVQQPTTHYVFTGGTNLQFLSPPSTGVDNISVIHNLGSTIIA